MTILETDKLSVWYEKEKLVLDEININIESGDIIGLLGKNGQGKSTLLNSVTGLHEEYSGKIAIMGKTSITDTDTKRLRYFVQDHPVLFDEMSADSYIRLLHSLYRKEFDEGHYESYIQMFDFAAYHNEKIASLSLGNRQKVVIIGALLIRAPLLILDEPLVGLDVISVEKFYEEMKNYADAQHAIVFSSHIMDILEHICTKVIILNKKKIVQEVTLSQKIHLREIFSQVLENE